MKMNTQETKTYQELIETESKIDWDSKEFWDIVRFYLLKCPTVNTNNVRICNRGKSLEDYGWSDESRVDSLRNALIESSYSLDGLTEWDKGYVNLNINKISPPKEYSVFKTGLKAKFLLKNIRDSLAHGRYHVIEHEGKKIYIFKNINITKKEQNAEIVLYEETLLNWIKVIKAGPASKKK